MINLRHDLARCERILSDTNRDVPAHALSVGFYSCISGTRIPPPLLDLEKGTPVLHFFPTMCLHVLATDMH
jgi:hypothetical protein